MKGIAIYKKEIEERVSRCKTIPEVRNAYKQKYSFSHLPFAEQLIIWDKLWKEKINYHVRTQAFFFCEHHAIKKENMEHAWNALKHWQNNIDDWPFCDGLSKIYTKHLEVFPDEVFKQLQKWNGNKDLWKRRQSIVSLLYYARTKKVILPYIKMLPLIHNLLLDEEYYVQKAVGWSLRELHNVYPEKTFTYLKKNIKSVSAIAFYAATEKLSKKEKDLLKSLRK
jgi:3-methyladenine DNA glycosylase AlkD